MNEFERFNKRIGRDYWESISSGSKARIKECSWNMVPRDLKIGIFEWIYEFFEPGNRYFDEFYTSSKISELLRKWTGIDLSESQISSVMNACGFNESKGRYNISNKSKIKKIMGV